MFSGLDTTKSDFDAYQDAASTTQLPVTLLDDPVLMYNVFGLVNEAGELAGKFKKIMRDKNGEIDLTSKRGLKKKMGDVLWYLSQIAKRLDVSLEEIATLNLMNLQGRRERGTLQGSGDDR